MITEIVCDTLFLAQRSRPATPDDLAVARDLYDTLDAHREDCVGMAANMIGSLVRIIAIRDGEKILVMLNPEIVRSAKPYKTEEGCLSLDGRRPVKRFGTVKVKWQDADLKPHIRTFEGFTAEIIQHEIDHLEGILI